MEVLEGELDCRRRDRPPEEPGGVPQRGNGRPGGSDQAGRCEAAALQKAEVLDPQSPTTLKRRDRLPLFRQRRASVGSRSGRVALFGSCLSPCEHGVAPGQGHLQHAADQGSGLADLAECRGGQETSGRATVLFLKCKRSSGLTVTPEGDPGPPDRRPHTERIGDSCRAQE